MFHRTICFLWLVSLLILLGGCERKDGEATGNSLVGNQSQVVNLIFTFGSEKEEWVEAVTTDFNQRKMKATGGKVIQVTSLRRDSAICLDELMEGSTKAHLTSPASSAYIKSGNAEWRTRTGKDLIPATESLLRSPVVIVLWQQMAETMGWGKQPVGWAEIHGLIADPQGWGKHGIPGWGKFIYGHTNPESSSSGLFALVSEVSAAAGKPSGLTVEDLARPEVARFVGDIEAAVTHSGNTTASLARKMFSEGPAYVHAIPLYESMLIKNYTGKTPPKAPFVAIYPKEGTFGSDHPVGSVDREWVAAEHREAARAYVDFLLAREQQEKAMTFGFRPARAEVPLVAPLDPAHGVNPQEPQTTIEVPSAEVMKAMMKFWEQSKNR